jgi:hypothetical protein
VFEVPEVCPTWLRCVLGKYNVAEEGLRQLRIASGGFKKCSGKNSFYRLLKYLCRIFFPNFSTDLFLKSKFPLKNPLNCVSKPKKKKQIQIDAKTKNTIS